MLGLHFVISTIFHVHRWRFMTTVNCSIISANRHAPNNAVRADFHLQLQWFENVSLSRFHIVFIFSVILQGSGCYLVISAILPRSVQNYYHYVTSATHLILPSVITLKNENRNVPKGVGNYFGIIIIVDNVVRNHWARNNNFVSCINTILLLPVQLF